MYSQSQFLGMLVFTGNVTVQYYSQEGVWFNYFWLGSLLACMATVLLFMARLY